MYLTTKQVYFALLLACICVCAFAMAGGKQSSAAWVANHYRDLEAITPTPVLADPTLLASCTTAMQKTIDRQVAKDGPHALTAISIYMNHEAAEAFRTRASNYPVGAIIVKEKATIPAQKGPPVAPVPSLAGESLVLNEAAKRAGDLVRSAGSGGMIKRAPGYDPVHGDWEYFYFTDSEHVEHGKLATCIQCHEVARSTDRVYGSWATSHR
jgi:hypothetical protein